MAIAAAMVPTAVGPTAMATAMVPTTVVPTTVVIAMVATAMAPTAVVTTITADTAVPTMKRCQLNSRLAAPAPVMTYHHSRREHLMAATIELCSRQATEKTVSPLRLRTGATRMKGISVVLFPPFSVAQNRVMAALLMSRSFQPAVAAVAPAVISHGPHRSTAAVTTATVSMGVRSSSTAPAPSVALAVSRGALAAMDR